MDHKAVPLALLAQGGPYGGGDYRGSGQAPQQFGSGQGSYSTDLRGPLDDIHRDSMVDRTGRGEDSVGATANTCRDLVGDRINMGKASVAALGSIHRDSMVARAGMDRHLWGLWPASARIP